MWSKINIEPHRTYHWAIRKKELFLKKPGKEWMVSDQSQENFVSLPQYGEVKEPKEDSEWQTFIGDKRTDSVSVLPSLPDRPIVIMPTSNYKVLPNKSVLLYIPIPPWLQFYAGNNKKENLFYECHSEELSSTWFGEPDSGSLAYSFPFNLSQAMSPPAESGQSIICPIRLNNNSTEILDVQRLLLHCEYLNVYSEGKQLFANETKIKFKGEQNVSDVQYSNHAPSMLKNAVQIASARVTKSQSVITKSFHFIKSLTNY